MSEEEATNQDSIDGKVEEISAEETEPTGDDSVVESIEDEPGTSAPIQLPPADFSTLVGMLSSQAMVTLGVLPNPATGKPAAQLEFARHFIDLLGILEEKTKGNLESEEELALKNTIHQLRMIYLEQTKSI